MTIWEYLAYYVGLDNELEELEHILNKLGRKGWELISIDWRGSVVIFKRPLGVINAKDTG